jgi:hypothetical protein
VDPAANGSGSPKAFWNIVLSCGLKTEGAFSAAKGSTSKLKSKSPVLIDPKSLLNGSEFVRYKTKQKLIMNEI